MMSYTFVLCISRPNCGMRVANDFLGVQVFSFVCQSLPSGIPYKLVQNSFINRHRSFIDAGFSVNRPCPCTIDESIIL